MTDRVVLHVGAPKSGTTYLQAILERNRDAFARAGVAAGGRLSKPVEDTEWGMYGGQLTDPDGHILDFFHMAAPQS